MKIKKFNQINNINENNQTQDQSVRELVERILDDCKLDVDGIEEADPEFIPYICNQILKWHKNNPL